MIKKFFRRPKKVDELGKGETFDVEQKSAPEGQKQEQNKIGKLLVGAIDFGTTYSGWAFSFLQDYKNDPTRASEALKSLYICYFFFEEVRGVVGGIFLGKERIDRSLTLEDEMGRSLPALDVFAFIISGLTKNMMEIVNKRLIGVIEDTDIHWVLTVPAIWTDGAKQFMREAAIQAGIDDSKLDIALEPEAASLFCRHLSVETTVGGSGMSVSQFKPGTRYLILDAGGGTIDTTIHKVVENGVKEVHAATGGSWGGTMVDRAFETMLLKIFSREVYDKFKKENTEDWIDLLRDFETKKRGINHHKKVQIPMKFPISLFNTYKSVIGKDFSKVISAFDDVLLVADKMKFSADCFRSFFADSIQMIIDHVQDIIKDSDVKAILMVGGYSESPLLQHAVQTAFPDKEVIIPMGASSTIVRGALIYGHSPTSITDRVLKYTYGIEICMPFIDGQHPLRKRISHDGKFQCKGLFDKLAEKDQTVPVGKAQTVRTYNPTATYQSVIPIRIFASDHQDPHYVDQDASIVGELTVEISDPDDDLHREITVCLTFSGTEIYVEAEDKKAGRKFKTSIDFLG